MSCSSVRVASVVIGALVVAGCGRPSFEYPPPEQRSNTFALSDLEPPFVEMSWRNTNEWIVRDISPVREGVRRWAFEHPELKFILNSTKRQTLVADVGLPPDTLAQTGPVTLSFFVNDHPTGALAYETAGDRRFSAPVPAEWLTTAGYTRVRIEPSRVFVAGDGAKLGFVLYRAGFVE